MSQLNIEYIDINDIIPYDKNPRKNDGAVDKVANSIKEFGMKQAIVIDKDNVIICGHTRLKACKKLGMQKVPCVRATDLSPEKVKAYRLADNKTAEFAEWDIDLLDLELAVIEIDMEGYGFVGVDDVVLDVNDNDFLQDTEITKEKQKKEIICPHCGQVVPL